VGGGAAEAFEQQLQRLIRDGYRNLVVDLADVAVIDSAGIRALVRGHTSARRVAGTLRLAAARPAVAAVLELSHLSGIFELHESVDAAKIAAWPWAAIRAAAGGTALCIVLVWAGLRWPAELAGLGEAVTSALSGNAQTPAMISRFQPFIELAKLVAAALIGILVTAVHHPATRDPQGSRSMEQAQMLLCVSGALMMIIIGNSLARAFGIAGAASIIRFRTPVEDPKDVTILFLLMGLGMSTGLGAFAVAGLGTAFLCLTLVGLDLMAKQQTRLMSVEIIASGRTFPSQKVEEVFARNQIVFEPREIAQSDEVTVKYHTWLDPRMSLDDVSAQLMRDAEGVTAVAWEHPKRR
jgi:anti-anti-sigma factor